MESLRNKVVIVTGSSSGIGAACAVSFARHGANVVLSGRNQQRLDEVAESCGSQTTTTNPGGVHAVRGDLSDEQNIRRLVDSTVDRFGRIDVLVHCAGYSIPRGTEHATVSDMRELWHLHVLAPFLLVKLCLPHLKRSRQEPSSIILISSLFGSYGMPMNLPYSVTKAAQNEFVRVLAPELASDGVRVNAVQPGWVRTGIIEHSGVFGASYFGELMFKICDRLHPIGRSGKAEEIGEYTAFIASDAARHVNGQVIAIDGGGKLPVCFAPTFPFRR